MTCPPSRHPAARATDREVGVVAAVLVAGSEKAAAHCLGLSHSTVKHHLANARSRVGADTTAQLVWILAPRLPEPEGMVRDVGAIDENREKRVLLGASRRHQSIKVRHMHDAVRPARQRFVQGNEGVRLQPRDGDVFGVSDSLPAVLASDPPGSPSRDAVAQQPDLHFGESLMEPQRLVLGELTSEDLLVEQ